MSQPTIEEALGRTARAAAEYAAAEASKVVAPEIVHGARRAATGDARALYDGIGEAAGRRGHARQTAYAGVGGLLGALFGSFFGRFGAGIGALFGALFGASLGNRRDRALPPGNDIVDATVVE